jgi:hypothetical protein
VLEHDADAGHRPVIRRALQRLVADAAERLVRAAEQG